MSGPFLDLSEQSLILLQALESLDLIPLRLLDLLFLFFYIFLQDLNLISLLLQFLLHLGQLRPEALISLLLELIALPLDLVDFDAGLLLQLLDRQQSRLVALHFRGAGGQGLVYVFEAGLQLPLRLLTLRHLLLASLDHLLALRLLQLHQRPQVLILFLQLLQPLHEICPLLITLPLVAPGLLGLLLALI